MFRFAHLSDPHLPLPDVRMRELLSKRMTGWLSWRYRRRRIHAPDALAAAVTDLRRAAPDHVAVTGDIANISTAAEFRQAAAWLRELGRPEDVTLVPGNHDAYVPVPWATSQGLWGAYMAGDGAAPPASRDDFPLLRRRGCVAFIGLSTALPRAPLIATGEVGAAQLARFEAMMRDLRDLCRVVLIHHPPQIGGASRHKELSDQRAVREAIARVGADLVLHGHMHRTMLGRIESPQGPVPVLGVASTSAHPASKYGAGGYNMIGVERDPDGGWRFDVEVRSIRPDLSGCDTGNRFHLRSPTPAVAA
ncbi:MAG: metallophosphoesterase [Alphaproteobacteria bacterium]|nr:metallophosphoesterase [Alphaproteobacteria bacterium]